MLCQQTSPKRWFANVNMTSYSDVTDNVYPVIMINIRHCSILKFGTGAYNYAVAPGITRPLHATEWRSLKMSKRSASPSMSWLIFKMITQPKPF